MKKLIVGVGLLSQIFYFSLFPLWERVTHHLHPIVHLVIWLFIVFLFYSSVLIYKRKTIHIPTRYISSIFYLYCLSLLVLLFFRPEEQHYTMANINLIPFKTIIGFLTYGGNFVIPFYNITANIVLFVPIGIYIRKFYPWSKMKLFIFPVIVITLIELLQFILKRGSLDIDDLILNVIGFHIGYLMYWIFTHRKSDVE